jgi:hypothetical protein
MATTRLIDVFIPEVYGTYGRIDSPILLAFIESGIIRTDGQLDAFADSPGNVFTIPYWNDLDTASEPNASTDNPDDVAVPQKITSGQWMARKAEINNSWSAMNLTRELAAADPLAAIRARTNNYWNVQKQRRLLAVCLGVMRANIANNGGDMVKSIYSATAGTITDANRFGTDVFVDAAYTLGDRADSVGTLAVHSAIMARLVKLNLIGRIPVGDGTITVPSFLGKPVMVDDVMPVETINGNLVYTSVLFSPGAIGFGEGSPVDPAWVELDQQRGNGAGMETFGERKTWLMHPAGHSWNEGPAFDTANPLVAGQAMEANLSSATRWTRVVPRKLLPLAFIRSNA